MKQQETDAMQFSLAKQSPRKFDSPGSPSTPVTAVERRLLKTVLHALGDPPLHFRFWDGSELSHNRHTLPEVGFIVRDRGALWRMIRNPNLHVGEDYASGRLGVIGSLERLVDVVYGVRPSLGESGWLKRLVLDASSRQRRNTLRRAQENIHRHYDIGNDFYRLWLDEQMQYTCAYYPQPSATLEAAQFAKMDHVCRKLRLQPGETVAEAGCGWGGLSRHMARHYGVKVKAFNISHEQIREARRRAEAEGLAGRVEYIEDDYRHIEGQFDAFVSVGMLEHVGKHHFHQLGEVINRCLAPTGRGLIHSIGQNQSEPLNPWIDRYIFPGAYPPTLREMLEVLEPWAMSVLDVENLRLHYAKTLEHWLARFENHVEEIEDMFDEEFVRMWRFYLASSMGSFTSGSLQLFQVVFSRQHNNVIPWTREYLYHDDVAEEEPWKTAMS
jgi:cyclopropane-fatty-acyl-phospholipid synthase